MFIGTMMKPIKKLMIFSKILKKYGHEISFVRFTDSETTYFLNSAMIKKKYLAILSGQLNRRMTLKQIYQRAIIIMDAETGYIARDTANIKALMTPTEKVLYGDSSDT